MKNNILVFSNSISGLYTFRGEVMKAISDADYNVYCVGPEDDKKRKTYSDIGCKIIHLPLKSRGLNPLVDLKLLYNYTRLIKKYRPKAVLTYTIKPNIYGGMACRMTSTPQIANITGLGDALENEGWIQTIAIKLYHIGLHRANKVFFQNSYNKEFCINQHIVNNVQTGLIPGSGVNLRHHSFQTYPEEGPIRFIFMGRLLRDKGAREYLDMAEYIGKKYKNVEIQILGMYDEEYESDIKKLIDAKIIQYFESTIDVRPYLKQAHCSVMPSYHEGMSNVNLESAANGRPVITTNVPGCKETVDDGITGFIAEPRSSQSLIDCVERFINLPYSEKVKMGLEGRKKVEREFDRQIVVNAYLNEINRIK